MTGIIIIADQGQDYVEFFIVCDVIRSVKPSTKPTWPGTKILNTKYVIGGKLKIDLQWRDFQPTLEQPIISITPL